MVFEFSYTRFISILKERFTEWQILLFSLLINILLGELYPLFTTVINPVFNSGYSKAKIFIIAVFVSPVIETLVFQTFIISIILRITKNALFAVLVSGIIFGLAHNYSLAYISKTMLSGLLYANLYIICKERKPATLYVMLFHAAYNFIILTVDTL